MFKTTHSWRQHFRHHLVAPVFRGGAGALAREVPALIRFLRGLPAHHADVAAIRRFDGLGREIYQEGFRIPPVKIMGQE